MKTSIVYRLQAYMAVSPRFPRWTTPSFEVVNTHEKYRWWDGGHRVCDPRLVADDGGWTFVDAVAAASVLSELQSVAQKYYLRTARIVKTEDVFPFGGADIEDGTIVDGPGDKKASARNPFWNVPADIIDSIVPAHEVRGVWGG